MTSPPGAARRALTLVELLVSISVIGILAALTLAAVRPVRSVAQGAYCANSLRQLGMATSLYLADHQNVLFDYKAPATGGALWYYGFETSASLGSPEGSRTVDETQAPIYPYVLQVGGVEICPSFPYGQAIWKPKYKGASWGYGYNALIKNKNVLSLRQAQVILFGDCAQVNNFQAPASPTHPMIEEFYTIDSAQYNQVSVHFRHGSHANMLFLDGHVQTFTMYPGTLDARIPSANIGRITAVNSTQYLQ